MCCVFKEAWVIEYVIIYRLLIIYVCVCVCFVLLAINKVSYRLIFSKKYYCVHVKHALYSSLLCFYYFISNNRLIPCIYNKESMSTCLLWTLCFVFVFFSWLKLYQKKNVEAVSWWMDEWKLLEQQKFIELWTKKLITLHPQKIFCGFTGNLVFREFWARLCQDEVSE